MANFREFKEFKNLLRYLKQKGHEPPKGSVEYNNMKSLFENTEEKAVGVLTTMCPQCGRVSDGGRVIVISKDSDTYRKYTESPEVPRAFCSACMYLTEFLSSKYEMSSDEMAEVFETIEKIKEKRGV